MKHIEFLKKCQNHWTLLISPAWLWDYVFSPSGEGERGEGGLQSMIFAD
jgi:hypothetical protein